MAAVWKNGPPTSTQRIVLLALADNANDEGQCYPSLKTIAEKCALSRRAVAKAIDKLEADGYVSHRRRFTEKGEPTSNVYQVSMERLSIPVVNDVQYPMEQRSTPMELRAIQVVNDVHQGIEPRAHDPSFNHQSLTTRGSKSAQPPRVAEMRASSPRFSPPPPPEPVKPEKPANGNGAGPEPRPHDVDMINAISDVTGVSARLNFARVQQFANELLDARYTPEQLLWHYGKQPAGFADWNYYKDDWRGRKGDLPTEAIIRNTIAGAVQARAQAAQATKRLSPMDRLIMQHQQEQAKS